MTGARDVFGSRVLSLGAAVLYRRPRVPSHGRLRLVRVIAQGSTDRLSARPRERIPNMQYLTKSAGSARCASVIREHSHMCALIRYQKAPLGAHQASVPYRIRSQHEPKEIGSFVRL